LVRIWLTGTGTAAGKIIFSVFAAAIAAIPSGLAREFHEMKLRKIKTAERF
jgi:hypothetical protein